MELKTSPVITRYPGTILSRFDVPYPSCLTFNAGIIRYEGKYVMIFRNDFGSFEEQRLDGTNLGLAFSDDGIKWDVEPEPIMDKTGFSEFFGEYDVIRVYDPRITAMDGRFYLSCAIDTHHGVHGGFAVTDDFHSFEFISVTVPDNRNMVLFPEKIGGKFVRLERPMPVYSRGCDRFDIWLSESPDLIYWGNPHLVLGVEDVPFANDKIGPGAPPIKTDRGWLIIYHAVDLDPNRGKNGWEPYWRKRYTIGAALLDLDEPWKVMGMMKEPLMVPEGYYEMEQGFRTNALFPCAALVDDEGKLRIYHSAGDCILRLATAKLEDVLDLCCEKRK
ncbi:MAG: glycosidase [Clostridiales bacterium]|nr:glycosidase [Clostridiales bacterium]